jgi:hypothetical protein
MLIGTRVLILAAGSNERWDNYLGVPKHLIEIDGERLVERIARQFGDYADEVVIVGPKDPRYGTNYAVHYAPATDWSKEMDKFVSSMKLWGDQNVVLVYGDVYFTDEAVKTIMTYSGDWKYFCRPWPSKITGKNCKEVFAIYIPPHNTKLVKENIKQITNIQTGADGWSLFRQLTLGTHGRGPDEDRAMFEKDKHIVIDDLTEDFDCPRDYDNWLRAKNSLT